MKNWCLAAVGLWLAATAAHADEKVRFEPTPAWVVAKSVPSAKTGGDGDVGILLQDNQTRFGDSSDEFYTNYADQVRSSAGLQEEGAVTIDWNPDIEVLHLHTVEIIRDGKAIDAIGDRRALTILRREKNLEQAVLDGDLTLTFQLEGLAIGDVVHVAYTIERHDPALNGHSAHRMQLARPRTVEHGFFRAVWPKSKDMKWQLHPGLDGKVQPTADGQFEFVAEGDALKAPNVPAHAPARFNVLAEVEFSQYKSFKELSAIFAPLYADAAVLKPDSPLLAEIEKIRLSTPDPKARAMAALSLVESQVRYLLITLNDGGYKPAPADLTWTRKFGDCKGKTVLLLALLKGLGIEAEPALVDSDGGDGMDQRLPSPSLFDHVLVRATIDGAVYWLDATRIGEYRLERPEFNAAFALPLRADGSDLIKPPRPSLEEPDLDSLARFDVGDGTDKPAKAHIEHTWRGEAGLEKGLEYSALSPSNLDQGLRKYWQEQIKWLRPDKVSFSFDRTRGVTRFVADGRADVTWAKGSSGSDFDLGDTEIGWNTSFAREPGPYKDAPYSVVYPFFRRWIVDVHLPEGGTGFTVFNSDSVDRVVAGIRFIRKTKTAGADVNVETIEQAVQPEFPATEAVQAERDLREMASFDVFIRKTIPDTSTAELASFRKDLGAAVNAATAGDAKLAAERLKAVIEDRRFAKLTGQERAAAHTLRAAAALELGDYATVHTSIASAREVQGAPANVADFLIKVELQLAQAEHDQNGAALVLAKILDSSQQSPLGDEQTVQIASDANGDALFRLLTALQASKWRPKDPFQSMDELWVRLARMQVARKDYEAAAKTVEKVEDPTAILVLRVDNAFTDLVKDRSEQFDIAKAVARNIQTLEARVKANADRMSGVAALAHAYRQANRAEDAVRLLDTALARTHPAPDEKLAFVDQVRVAPLAANERAHGLADLGRFDEAGKSFERTAHRTSGPGANISLMLNYTGFLIVTGKATEAADELADVNMQSLSPYGVLVMQSQLACANAQSGQKDKLEAALAYLKSHTRDRRLPYLGALICAARLDDAEDALKTMLKTPETRDDALKVVQDFPDPPHETEWGKTMRLRLREVRNRPSVRAAIASVGRIEFVPIY